MVRTERLLLPILIGLVILPRISIDLYLPSLTQIGMVFHASDQSLQMTLTMFMFGYAISMLIAGPLSDALGNKRVVLYGLSLYCAATIISMLASSITILMAARFFQALGGGCGTLIARVMVKENYNIKQQIHILAHLSTAMAICPLLIPILGGTLQLYAGWQPVFFVLAVFGLILLITCQRQMHTSMPRHPISMKNLFLHYRQLLTHRLFLAYSIAIGCAWANYFAFTIESPFLFQEILGYNAIAYGIMLALSVIGYLIGISLTRKYANTIGWNKLITIAMVISLIGASLMTLLIYLFTLNWIIIIAPMMIVMIGVGIIIPCTQGAVMQPFAHIAGTASGLFFFIQMLFGGLCGLILQSLPHHSALPLALVMLGASALLIFTFPWLTSTKHLINQTNTDLI